MLLEEQFSPSLAPDCRVFYHSKLAEANSSVDQTALKDVAIYEPLDQKGIYLVYASHTAILIPVTCEFVGSSWKALAVKLISKIRKM